MPFISTANTSEAAIVSKNRNKSILCQEDIYFKELVRYIHLNPLRMVVRINYPSKTVFVLFIGTHLEYDRINAEVI